MKKLLWLLPFVLLFMGCQKETSFEVPITTNGTSSGTSIYTLGGAGSSCTGAAVAGTYTNGVALGSANTVTINVSVTTVGTYSISTTAVNGMTFKGSGTFSATGAQTIVLTGSGTPTTVGTSTVSVTVGTSTCTFSVLVVPAGSTTPAVYTLGGASSTCTGATIAGTYTNGTVLNTTNTVKLSVNVTTIGSYSITTAASNGITFSATGSFTITGTQIITLVASGTPTTVGNNTITATVGTSSCTFIVPVVAPLAPATYTISGAGGACTGSTVSGTYNAGTALSATNTATIQVNVTSVGSYTISTAVANGISFSGTGNFTANGVQSVILTGTGIPTTAGTNTFTPRAGTSTCTFDVIIGAATLASGIFSCKSNGVYTAFPDNDGAIITDLSAVGNSSHSLYISGYTADVPGQRASKFSIIIGNVSGSSVTTGTYDITNAAKEVQIAYLEVTQPNDALGNWITFSNIGGLSNPPFTVIITSISLTRVVGTFSGQLYNSYAVSLPYKSITAGSFDLPIQ